MRYVVMIEVDVDANTSIADIHQELCEVLMEGRKPSRVHFVDVSSSMIMVGGGDTEQESIFKNT